ncbi:choice-of-anchor K domain-containing protein [Halovibrio sp. HP20-50]|uniref:choice-of-anchor K domain-containing protein n=1 Tax=Halovibrio sp. HP20-59 TaxID=3080275 RepID=UPI00294B113B|nr:choice-of-anchor K domain-containing protein [Halovibrio sp. HP20-59]MEA2119460.1 choice-of-anchor K domain-containing protein [Halovibrio sp. HP20-59]
MLVSINGEQNIVEGETSTDYTVSLSQAIPADGTAVTVALNYSGTAQDGTDFNGVASVTIPAGSNSTTFTLDTIDDALAEGVEGFTITIGDITDSNFENIEADASANSVDSTITDNDVSLTIGDGSVVVYEEGIDLPGDNKVGIPDGDAGVGYNDTTNATVASGTLAITGNGNAPVSVGIELGTLPNGLTSGGNDITWSHESGNEAVAIGSADGQEVIRIELNGGVEAVANSGSATSINYEVTLTQPVDHPVNSVEDTLSFAFDVSLSDGINDPDTGTVTVTVEDDMPVSSVGSQDLNVIVNDLAVGGLSVGWSNVSGGRGVNINNQPAGQDDVVRWDGSNSNSTSNYTFDDNNNLTGTQSVSVNSMFELGEFTHNNFSISSGSGIDSVNLDLSLDIVINGYSATINHTINFDHNETPNSGSDPRDIVTINNASTIVPVEITTAEGVTETYNFQIIGFVDQDGKIVDRVLTEEDASNSYKLMGQLVSSDAPDVTGQVDYSFGADGPADEDAIVWNDGSGVTDDGSDGVKVQGEFGVLTVDANGNYSYQLDQAAYDELTAGETEVDSFAYTLKDADGDSVESTLDINITGEAAPQKPEPLPEAKGPEDSDGIDITLSGSILDGDGNVESFVIQTLPANGTLYFGNTMVTANMSIDATDNSATLTFVPETDWSDNNGDEKVTFDYIAVDVDGNQSDPATATVDVTPVTDTPDVELTLTESSTSSLYAVDLSNVLNNADGQSGNPAGFTVTAFKNGQIGNISIKDTGSPTGFGVAGSASNGADSEIGKGEKLHIELDTPASSVAFQLAWLNSYNETAVYEVHYDDGSSETFSVYGGSDGIDPPMTVDAPAGKAITGIDFRTGSHNESTSDYLLHSFSYESTATTYTVDITAEPTDADFSESITHLVVKAPVGTTLSGAENLGNDNGVTTWGIALDSTGGHTNSVEVNPVTGVVTVKGLILSVPDDFTGVLNVEAIATANDPGASTSVDGSDSATIIVTASEYGDYPGVSHLAIAFQNDDGALDFVKLEGVLSDVGINDSQAIIKYVESQGYEWRAIRAKGGSENSNHDASTFDYLNEYENVSAVEWKVNNAGQVTGVVNVTQSGDDITKGQLIDGIVEGAMYASSSGLSGTTEANGSFEYREGDSVTFMVGDVVIGTASAEALSDGKVFLQEIANTELADLNNEYVENMAVFLQSLDADGNAYNGITITAAMHAAFEGSTLDLRNTSEADLKAALEEAGANYVNEEEAMQHVRDMLEKHAGVTQFDEHTNDSIKTAVLAHEALEGLTYQTSSGLTGELANGAFSFDEGDIVELFADGQLVASFAADDIGEDGLITFAEAGFTISAEELDALINGEEGQALEDAEPTENIPVDDDVTSDDVTGDDSSEEITEEDVATPDEKLSQDEVLAEDDEVTNVAPATAEAETEESQGIDNGYSLIEEDEPLFTSNDDSENATTSVPVSELQTSESEGDTEDSLSESELFSSDEDESVDSLLPPSESGEEKAKPASDTSQESTVSTEAEPAGGHTDYVKLHNDHSTQNTDI